MLIFLASLFFILTYGPYRCIKDRNLSFFRHLGGLAKYTLFTGNKAVSALLWVTVFSSAVLSNIIGPMQINFTFFNRVSHFLFGFLSRELISTANEYYPFVDKISEKLPEPVSRHVTPSTLSFILCMGNGVQEEIQKAIPGLKRLVWTNFKDQVADAVMDTAGISLSAKRRSLAARLIPDRFREPGEEAGGRG